MKRITLFLLLIAGLSSGRAGAEEKKVVVAVIAGNPDEGWRAYDAAEIMAPPFLRWEPLFSESVCAVCRADAGDAVAISRTGSNEDLVYHVVKALQRSKDEFQRNENHAKQPPPHAWEENGDASLYEDGLAVAGESVPSVAIAFDNAAPKNE